MSLKEETIISKINQLLIEKFEISEEKLNPKNKLIEDLGFNSLDMVALTADLLKLFPTHQPPDEALINLQTLQDVYNICIEAAAERDELK